MTMIDLLPTTAISARRKCDARRPTDKRCDALFAEILKNDVIDPDAQLPDKIDLDFVGEQFEDFFSVSRELWRQWLVREELVRIANKLYRDCWIDKDDRLIFKHVRVRFKHLRFAFAVFDDRHRYPLCFDAITSVMGNLQDAFKNDRLASVRRNALLLRVLLNGTLFNLVIDETSRFRPTTPEKFRRYLKTQAIEIARLLESDLTTAKAFHDTRKIISRYRACFATIVTIRPTDNNIRVAAYLATINGLMGNFHDILMAKKLNGTLDYHRDRFAMQDEIRQRLQKLASSVH